MSDLRRVADELEIRNLLARIAQLSDTGDVAEYVDQFTEDARWEMPDNPRIGLAGSVRTGREVIEEGVHERRAAGVQGPGSDSLHAIVTSLISFDDADTARGHTYFQYYASATTAPALQNMGQYRDTFRRTPDGWKLAERIITFG